MQAVRFRRNSDIPGGWDIGHSLLCWDDKRDRYIVVGDWHGDINFEEEVKQRLALLIASPPNTHIHGIGFRSDYEGDDRHIEPFFYVVI